MPNGIVRLRLFVFLFASLPLLGQSNPKDEVQAHYRKAADAMRLRDFDAAAEEFRAMIRLDPNLAEAHANLGGVYYIQHKYPEASAEFESALKLKPALVKAKDLLGLSEARSGHIEKALPLLENTFERPEKNEFRREAGILLVDLFKAVSKPERARLTLDSLRRDYPANPEVLYVAYRTYSEMAGKALADLVHAAPDSAHLHQVAGELLDSEGDFPHAVEQYQKALEKDPSLPGVHRALGVALMNSSQDDATIEKARNQFEQELGVNPDDAHSEYQLGEIFWRKHDAEQAVKHYARAAKMRPNFVDALVALGKVWTSQDRAQDAANVLQEAVKIDPANEVAHYRLSQAYHKLGQNAEAGRELAEFRKLREASASLSVIYQQVQRKPITEQTIESRE
jgi:tetratricopeptide (TPR) repeat protein